MSDCSTEAMKPKKPLLTNEILQGFADRIAAVAGMPESADCPCGLVDVYHAIQSLANREQQAEQRCQQLEQVAKNLLGIAHGAAEEIMFPSRELVAKHARKLEALGVDTSA